MAKTVKVIYEADERGFTKGSESAGKAASKLEAALARLGPVGNAINGMLGRLGFGGAGAALGVGVGAAAIGTAAAMAEKAIGQYADLVTKIRDYRNVTGESAEVSSRQVQVFEELGVASDVASAGMFKLDRAIANTPEKLAAVGIEVAHNADGNVDLDATLLNVMEAYQRTADASQRAAIVFAAFGKGGAALIPILETDRAEFKRLEAAVSIVVTDADIKQVREYQIQQKQLKQSTDALGESIGRALLPAQKAFVESLNENIYVSKRMDEAQQNALASGQQQLGNTRNLGRQFRQEYEDAQKAQEELDKLAESHKQAAEEAAKEEEAERKLSDAFHSGVSAEFALEQAHLDLAKAQQAVTDKTGDAAEENLRLREAFVKVADATVAYAVQQAALAGQTLTTDQQNEIWKSTLQDLANGLDPNSPLRKNLQAYIDQLKSIPSSVSTQVTVRGASAAGVHAGGRGLQELERGGMVAGPAGAAVPVVAHGGEMVLNRAQQRALGEGRSPITVTNHFHIGADALEQQIARQVRRVLSDVVGNS